MNHAQLIDFVVVRTGQSRRDAKKFSEAFLEGICEALSRGEDVKVFGFGVFKVAQYAARVGVNPRTGKKIKIAAHRLPRFTPGAILKRAAGVDLDEAD